MALPSPGLLWGIFPDGELEASLCCRSLPLQQPSSARGLHQAAYPDHLLLRHVPVRKTGVFITRVFSMFEKYPCRLLLSCNICLFFHYREIANKNWATSTDLTRKLTWPFCTEEPWPTLRHSHTAFIRQSQCCPIALGHLAYLQQSTDVTSFLKVPGKLLGSPGSITLITTQFAAY